VPLPPKVDQKIRSQLKKLVERSHTPITPDVSKQEIFTSLRTQFQTLLNHISSDVSAPYLTDLSKKADETLRSSADYLGAINRLRGLIRGLKAAYEDGMLERLTEHIEAQVTADYLGQATQLLKEGTSKKYEHVPAAVLTGAILEDALRRLCKRQSPPTAILKPSGDHKTMMPLIDDLKKAGLYNELKATQLRAWTHIRNKAAHGEFEQFKKGDVEEMLSGVQNFLADYL